MKQDTPEKPGVKLARFTLAPFWAFFIAAIVSSLAVNIIGLNLSILLGAVLIITGYVVITQILIGNSLRNSKIKIVGKTKLGAPIFEVNDQIANALALGFIKKFRYVVITSGFSKIFSNKQPEYWAVIDHEDNHIRQMHNFTEILTLTLLLTVWISVLSYAVQTPIFLIVSYTTISLMALLFSRLLHRGLETLADKTADPLALKSALTKIEEHNKTVTKQNVNQTSFRGIFASHPRTKDRPLQPIQVKDASIIGAYLSFLLITGLVAKAFSTTTFSNEMVIIAGTLILSSTILGAGLVVIEYLFISNLMSFLSSKLVVKSFCSINALTGIAVLLVLTAIPQIAGLNSPEIIGTFTLCAIGLAIIITAIGTKPLKKGILAAGVTWALNSGIFIAAFLILMQVVLNLV